MRTFNVNASEKKRAADKTPVVEFVIFDSDKRTSIRAEITYGRGTGRDRDHAYATLKDLAGAAIRQRVADEILPRPEGCPNNCTKGYLKTPDGGLGLCDHPACREYSSAVINVGSMVDLQVFYRPGTHHDHTFKL